MISLIVPVYNNEAALSELCSGLLQTLKDTLREYEIIFVDDGSSDKSLGVLEGLQSSIGNIEIVKLANNFGREMATLAGIELSKGEIIVTFDADLQYYEKDIPKLIYQIDNGADLVCGYRIKRQDSILFRKIPSFFANIVAKIWLSRNVKDIGCSFMVFRKELYLKVREQGDAARFLKPLLISLANRCVFIGVVHRPRKFNRSQYTMSKLLKVASDFIFNFQFRRSISGGL